MQDLSVVDQQMTMLCRREGTEAESMKDSIGNNEMYCSATFNQFNKYANDFTLIQQAQSHNPEAQNSRDLSKEITLGQDDSPVVVGPKLNPVLIIQEGAPYFNNSFQQPCAVTI